MFRKLIAISITVLFSAVVMLAHGDATHVMGTVSAIEGDHVTVKLQDGKTQMVMFDKSTKYLNGEKAAKRDDVKVGTRVVIDAKMDEKMKMLTALEVRVGVTETQNATKK